MKVGIVGSGTMGRGISLAFAMVEGYAVFLCNRNAMVAGRTKQRIAGNLQSQDEKGKTTQAEVDAILARITPGTKYLCTEADLVI